jgi:hypothetical protein
VGDTSDLQSLVVILKIDLGHTWSDEGWDYMGIGLLVDFSPDSNLCLTLSLDIP